MYKIYANEPITGVGYGLHFIEGVATTDKKDLADKLESKGYCVEEIEMPIVTAIDVDEKDSDDGEEFPDGENQKEAEEKATVSLDDNSPTSAPVRFPELSDLQKMGRTELDAYATTLDLNTKEARNKETAVGMIQAKLAKLNKNQ